MKTLFSRFYKYSIILTAFSLVSFSQVDAANKEIFYSSSSPKHNIQSFTLEKINETQPTAKIAEFGYNPEITPLVLAHPHSSQKMYFYPSSWTWLCKSPLSIPSHNVSINSSNCSIVTKSDLISGISKDGMMEINNPDSTYEKDWLFSYDGIMGADIVTVNEKKYIFFIRHGEHQNSEFQGKKFQGKVFPYVDVENCAGGYVNNEYKHCWESFASYANFGWAPLPEGENWNTNLNVQDEGPIIWPSKPYKGPNGKALGAGPYAPTLFVDHESGYMYVYFINANNGGRHCMSAARAKIDSFGKPGSWMYYHKGSFTSPTLPNGFTKDTISKFYTKPGGKADCLANEPSANFLHFNVAKIQGTPYYIGVGEDTPENKTWRLWVRLSKDLVNWTDPVVLDTANQPWGASSYHYPTLLDKKGNHTNKAIDPEHFYIMGKHATNSSGYELNVMHMKLSFEGSNDNKPSLNREERLVKNYYKHFLGWNMKTNDEGFKWHVDYLKRFGCKEDVKNFLYSDVAKERTNKMSNSEFVAMLYRGILMREPDNLPKHSQWWVHNLNSGNINRDNIVDKIFEGWEAKLVCKTGKHGNWSLL